MKDVGVFFPVSLSGWLKAAITHPDAEPTILAA
jgi:hypothetical protein